MGKKDKKDKKNKAEPEDENKAWEVDVNAQRFIRTTTPVLLDSMIDMLETESEKMAVIDFTERLEALYALRSAPHREALRRSFDMFCPDPDGGTDHASLKVAGHADGHSGHHSHSRLEQEEDVFLELLHMAFSKANFQLLSQSEYDAGQAESFEVAIDMEINAKKLDSEFIERLHDRMQHEDEFAEAASVTRQVLVYHRGQGQTTTTGMFIMEKVDLLLLDLWDLVIWLIFFFLRMLRESINLRGHFRRMVWLAGVVSHALVTHGVGKEQEEEEEETLPEDEPTIDTPKSRKVYRNTLRRAVHNNWFTLLTPVTLIEPTYREMVIVYRMKEEAKAAAKAGRVPHVEIKTFANVPMADFEVILPAQRTITRASDILKLLAVIGGAAAYVYKSIQEAFTDDPDAMMEDVVVDMFPVLLGAGTYASKALTQWLNAQKKYNTIITQYLFEKSFANNFTVFSYVMDSIIHQEHKEALLAYFFLWQHGAQSSAELDKEVERFLARLNEDIDFDAQDALDKLSKDGLIRFRGDLQNQSQLFYLPIVQCIHKVEEKVTKLLYDKNRPCPYCSVLDELKS
eukprot:m.149044 g.149044  ORF g.149044 m.149044 type:complete len:571 (-) comp14223_c0_seq1:345-2057(-)